MNATARLADRARALLGRRAAPFDEPEHRGELYEQIRERFIAWWNGDIVDADEIHIEEDDDAPASDEPEPPWSARRIKAIERIWGTGYLEPGGERFARRLLAVLAVTSKHTVLDLSAGLGGSARALATQRKLWMDAFEPIAEIAREGQRRSAIERLGKRVRITPVDYDQLRLRERRYDAIYSRERLCGVEAKEAILDQCAIGLKERGQILITDYVAAGDAGEANERWAERDGATACLWTLERYRSELLGRGFRIQIAQELTDEFLSNIHAAWLGIPRIVSQGKISRRDARLIIDEGEVWRRRTDALTSGLVVPVRLHATLDG